MRSIVCCVFDSAVQSHGRPMFFQSIGVALRSFTDEVNRVADDNSLNRHPDDFDLRYVADFEEETGTFHVPEEGKRVLVRAKDVVRSVT